MKIAFLIGSVRGRGYKLDFLNESLQFLGRNFCTLIWFLAVKVPETLIDHVINFSWKAKELGMLSEEGQNFIAINIDIAEKGAEFDIIGFLHHSHFI
jgi:hypothetical protein